MKKLLIILCLCPLLSGCFFFSHVWNPTVGQVFPCLKDIPCDKEHKWDWRAGKLLADYPDKNCVWKVSLLKEEMLASGEHFSVIHGSYCNEGHTWIEYHGRKIDPSVYKDYDGLYREFSRENY